MLKSIDGKPPFMQRLAVMAMSVMLMASLAGCIADTDGSESPGTFTLDVEWTQIVLETKTQYYSDEEIVSWDLTSTSVDEQIREAGGIVVGVVMSLEYPEEDESPNFGLCTGFEDNVPDIISGTVSKNDWSLTNSDSNPGSHEVNLTWHNQSLLEKQNISGMTKSEILSQIDYGEEALGTYSLSIVVDAQAHEGATCTHTDNGENVQSAVALLVLRVGFNGSDEDAAFISVGDSVVPLITFSPWFIGMFVLVGYLTSRKEKYQLGIILEENEPSEYENVESEERGNTLVESYRARVLTLCALYVAQGIPWGFITVTFVTYLAVEGVSAGQLAYLLTLGTLPWSVKFLWGPIIDRFQFPEMGKRRPWILIAQSGMILVLSAMLLIPNMSANVNLVGIMFLIYNVFTALQDVSTDALAVDVLESHEFEKVNSYMFTSKAIGGIIGGAGLGTIISFTGVKFGK